MTTITRLLVILSLGLVLLGCSETSATESSAAPEPTYDLEAIMRGFAETCRTENEILAKASRSFDSIDDADRRNYFSALQTRMRLADEWKAMSLAHPSWAQTSCDWFESVVERLHLEGVRLRNQLGRVYTPDGRSKRNLKLHMLLHGAASSREREAYKASGHFFPPESDMLCESLPQFLEDLEDIADELAAHIQFNKDLEDMLEKLPQRMQEKLEEIRRDSENH